jgi:predicted ATP-dependent serine protease
VRFLHQTVLQPDKQVPVVPGNFPSLQERGVALRAGELTVVAGPPGAGKSTLALALAVRSKAPTLYYSADTTEHTMRVRSLMMLTGLDRVEAESAMMSDRVWASQVLAEGIGHIGWDTSSSPTLEQIELQLAAFEEAWGEPPTLVVIDNAGDVAFDSGDEFGSLRTLMRELRWFARDTGAAFLVLHHTTERVPGNPAPPQHSLHGKIAQTPAAILTVVSDAEPGFMGVGITKNRYGRARPDGSDPVWLRFDPEHMALTDLLEPGDDL